MILLGRDGNAAATELSSLNLTAVFNVMCHPKYMYIPPIPMYVYIIEYTELKSRVRITVRKVYKAFTLNNKQEYRKSSNYTNMLVAN